jgi:hypothetical protein
MARLEITADREAPVAEGVLDLEGKSIVLGLTGGIAAYKSAFLARRLQEHGARVQVVMTPGAEQFITALTMQALTGQPVFTSQWDTRRDSGPGRSGERGFHGKTGSGHGRRPAHDPVPGTGLPPARGACDEQADVGASGDPA